MGIYFWTALDDKQLELADRFSRDWAKRSRDVWNQYRGEADSSLAAVQISVTVEDDEILYLDDPELHLGLRDTLINFALDKLGLADISEITADQYKRLEHQLYGVIEGYIGILEEELGNPIKLVFKSQIPPPGPSTRNRIYEMLGNASCFSVRDASCIEHPIRIVSLH
ncbi:hypothetical protein [Pseudomonas fulva]|uniref:hypothetical protein n=1 Tax=Pseudomonas fulva TaxID=47880 RepID=UPI0012F4CB27|nr:hypothetical protein [Pseudomonas fulva]